MEAAMSGTLTRNSHLEVCEKLVMAVKAAYRKKILLSCLFLGAAMCLSPGQSQFIPLILTML